MRRLFPLFAVVAGLLASAANAAPYTVTDLKPPDGSVAALITGSSQTADGLIHAFVYTPGLGMRDLVFGSTGQSVGNDIDESGNVIGSLFPGSLAFAWSQSGGVRELGPGSMLAFNFSGTVFGYQNNVPGMWNPPFTTFSPFGPVPSPFTNGYAYDGNIFGDAAGT